MLPAPGVLAPREPRLGAGDAGTVVSFCCENCGGEIPTQQEWEQTPVEMRFPHRCDGHVRASSIRRIVREEIAKALADYLLKERS